MLWVLIRIAPLKHILWILVSTHNICCFFLPQVLIRITSSTHNIMFFDEAILMSTHNIYFYREISKIMTKYQLYLFHWL